ncbi:hypothetical protein SAMN05444320_105488 [Streptoalloteichus hindustanus]|uniref:Uncharacterized protein n=1 Tax=Streptoalloteichus hindustanus TaxID=2017 RepID=A0A1M5FKZ5_STRHI|nr:hypothetical protein SAMN05444320_105488 [Streptoalloteichus hindustanus]
MIVTLPKPAEKPPRVTSEPPRHRSLIPFPSVAGTDDNPGGAATWSALGLVQTSPDGDP